MAAKRGKRGKRKLAKLRKKLGFVPAVLLPSKKGRFGSLQERVEAHGKACKLDKTRKEKQEQLDRKQKQKGWDDQ